MLTYTDIRQGLNALAVDNTEADRLRTIANKAMQEADAFAASLAEKHATLVTNVTAFLEANKADAKAIEMKADLEHLKADAESVAADLRSKLDAIGVESKAVTALGNV